MFKNALLCLVAFAVTLVLCTDASAIGRRRRGNDGGGMGAGGQTCNMRLNSKVRPGQCITGNCGQPTAAPAASATSVDGITGSSNKAEPKVAKAARPSHVNFDAPVNHARSIATR